MEFQILYKVATVFPTPGVMQNGSPAPSYTFAAGNYEYPFQFKVIISPDGSWKDIDVFFSSLLIIRAAPPTACSPI